MPPFDPNRLRILPAQAFVRERPVRFQDVDAAGIVFYPRMFEYCSDLLMEYLASEGIGLPEVLAEQRWAAPLRHVEAHYFRPLRFGDRIEVALAHAQLDGSGITLGYRIGLPGEERAVAAVQTTHAVVDPKTFQRCAVPDELRVALERFVSAT